MKSQSILKKSLAILVCVLMVLPLMLTALVGCGDGEDEKDPPKVTVESIALDTSNVKKSFSYGEEFTFAGLKVTATMSDKTTKDVALDDCRISTPTMTDAGTRSVTVTHAGKTARYEITIANKVYLSVDTASLVSISENAESAFRVEAEKINMTSTNAKPAGGGAFIAEGTPDMTPLTSDGKYLTNLNVVANYFGFTFTSDKAYDNVIIVMAMSYGGEEKLTLMNSMNMFLNLKDGGDTGKVDLSGKDVSESVDAKVWKSIVMRDMSVVAGANTLSFEIVGDKAPSIDYIDFYVGKPYVSTGIAITGKDTFIKDWEDFDVEKVKTRPDFIQAGFRPGEFRMEHSRTNIDGTSKGTNPYGYGTGTEISTTIMMEKDSTVKISVTASEPGAYKIKDNWEFSIDGVILDRVEDKSLKDASGAGDRYWEWNDTSLGKYNIEAGDHLFIAKVTGNHCNMDMFKFEVISYGKFESTTDANVTVNEEGRKHLVDAEQIVFSEDRTLEVPGGNAFQITSRARAVNPKAVAGNKFSFSVFAEEAATVKMNVFAAYGGEGEFVFDEYFRTKVGSTTLTTGATLVKDEGAVVYTKTVGEEVVETKKFTSHDAFKWNWKAIPVTLNLAKGLNEVSFTLKDKVEDTQNVVLPSFDRFELIVTKYADGAALELPEFLKDDCMAVIGGEGTYRVEAEKADYSQVALGKDNLDANQRYTEMGGGKVPTSNGLCVGKLANEGNVIKVFIYSDKAYEGKLSVTFAMAVGGVQLPETKILADSMLKFKLGTAFTAGETAVFTGGTQDTPYHNWEPFTVSGLSLVQGVNVLEIAVKNLAEQGAKIDCPNMDYFEFVIGA